MARLGTLVVVNALALLQAPSHAGDGALARLGTGGNRAVPAKIAVLAHALPVVAEAVVGAAANASPDVAAIAGPARITRAHAIRALAIVAAHGPIHPRAPSRAV